MKTKMKTMKRRMTRNDTLIYWGYIRVYIRGSRIVLAYQSNTRAAVDVVLDTRFMS
jgi:hypothetical protein